MDPAVQPAGFIKNAASQLVVGIQIHPWGQVLDKDACLVPLHGDLRQGALTKGDALGEVPLGLFQGVELGALDVRSCVGRKREWRGENLCLCVCVCVCVLVFAPPPPAPSSPRGSRQDAAACAR